MKEIMYLLTDLFQLLIMYNFFERMLKRRYGKVFTFFMWILIFVLDEIPMIIGKDNLFFILFNVLMIFALGVLYVGRIKKKVIAFLYIYIFILLSECIASVLLIAFSLNNNTVENIIVGSIISKLIFAVMIKIVTLINQNNTDLEIDFRTWAYVLIIPICSIIMMYQIFALRRNESMKLGDIVIYILCLVINYVAVVQFDSIQKNIILDSKNKLLRQQSDYYIKQSKIAKELWDETRKFRHDIRNQYIVEQELLDKEEYGKLKEKYSKNLEIMKSESKYCDTGNIYVDAIVNYKAEKLKEIGSEFECSFDIPRELPIENDDIILVLGNIFDNAIDALSDSDVKDKKCSIKMIYDAPNLIIKEQNNYAGERMINENGEYSTTKKDKKSHGIGLASINSIVEKNNGKTFINAKNNEFEILIHMSKSYI